jgi:FHA domain
MLILIVAEGPDKGRIYEWTDGQTVIVGRESKDLRLSDGKASRQHARFKCEGGKWYVRDLASRHGTFVNKIRTDGRTALADGDRVQIGRTHLVVARVPAEQAERAALLGGQPTGNEAWESVPTYRRYVPRASTAAAMTAAAFAVGCSAWLYMNTTDANLKLREDLLASQADMSSDLTTSQLAATEAQTRATQAQLAVADRTGQILDEVQALGSSSTPVLNEILASVHAQDGELEQLSEIRQALADLRDSSQPALDAILARVESQSAQWMTLAEVRDVMMRQRADTAGLLPELQAVALATRANEQSLDALRQQIEQAQTRPDLDARVLDQLEAVAAELQARPTLQQVVGGVRQTLAREQQKTDELLNRIEARLVTSPGTQELLAPLREALTRQAQATEQLAAQASERRDQTDGQLAELKTLVQAQPGETEAVLRGVVGQIDNGDDLDAVLATVKQIEARVVTDLDAQDLVAPLREALAEQAQATERLIAHAFERRDQTAEQLAELKTLVQAQPGETETVLRGVVGQINNHGDLDAVLAAVKRIEAGSGDDEAMALLRELAMRLESAPTSEQLAAAVTRAVSDQLDTTRPLLEQIASSLDSSAQQGEAGRVLLEQVRLALAAQQEADVRLDRIYDLLASSDSGADSEALRQVLREIRTKSIAGIDELRSTIRREIQAGLAEQRLASARDVGPGYGSVPAQVVADPEPAAVQATGTYALATAKEQDEVQIITQQDPARDDGLTDVEQAYRLAFKTGRPITLGGGSVDAKTGKVSLGRTLDPTTAKAAGITDWRDWYLMDDFAERMRLQQQAVKFHAARRGEVNVIGIPAEAREPADGPRTTGQGSGG